MNRPLRAAVMAAVLAPLLVRADEPPPVFSFSGFGTLGALRTDTDAGHFTTSVLKPPGPGTSWDLRTDSLIAAQLDARPAKNVAASLQLVSNRTARGDFEPHVESAFVRFAAQPDLALRAGIMAVPVFMLSDSRLVGISFPWVRPPTALYSQVPITSFRGADLVYRKAIGDAAITLQPFAGKAPTDVPDGSGGTMRAQLDRLLGLGASTQLGAWTLRAAWFRTDFTFSSPLRRSLVAQLDAASTSLPGATSLVEDLAPSAKRIAFGSVGAAYDAGHLFAQAEYGRRESKTLALARTRAWYGTLGYRFGNVMPHVTMSRVLVDSHLEQSVVPRTGEFAGLADSIDAMFGSQNVAQAATSLGVRWQFLRNADAKLQWDHVELPDGAVGNFRGPNGFAGRVNVYSVSVDFVF